MILFFGIKSFFKFTPLKIIYVLMKDNKRITHFILIIMLI